MNNLSFSHLPLLAKTRASERGLLLEEITNLVNAERDGVKYKKLSLRAIAVKVGHLSLSDLYYVLSVGKDYKNRSGSFSKYFFGSLKTK